MTSVKASNIRGSKYEPEELCAYFDETYGTCSSSGEDVDCKGKEERCEIN